MKVINNVIVKGGSIDPNDEGYIEYIIFPNLPNLLYYSTLVKIEIEDDEYTVIPTGLAITDSIYTGKSILAIAILPNAKLAQGNMSLTYKEVFEQMGVNYDSYTRLTKEEFYDLTAPTE